MGKKKKKMRPYTKDGEKDSKYKPSETEHSKQDKLIIKNANRSKKKAYRQQLKKQLKDEYNLPDEPEVST